LLLTNQTGQAKKFSISLQYAHRVHAGTPKQPAVVVASIILHQGPKTVFKKSTLTSTNSIEQAYSYSKAFISCLYSTHNVINGRNNVKKKKINLSGTSLARKNTKLIHHSKNNGVI
jgi:hypothetical protein